jgi:SAM-dependent methyltransferase
MVSHKPGDDLERLRTEYADRERRLRGSDLYSFFNPGNLFMWHGRQRALLALLRRQGFETLNSFRILEVGCGQGGVLQELLSYGALPAKLFGCDLLFDRLQTAHQMLPHLPLACADGQCLPYSSAAFELVLQFTVFSSILDEQIRQHLAQEMMRVLRPGGLILWYDFWINPTNPQTRGIRPLEVRRLFPGCQYEFRRITLAPPITRRLVGLSWQVCHFLERLKFLNTHYLAAIRKPADL